MPKSTDRDVQPQIGTLQYQGTTYDVMMRIAYDGVEYVGRLWFLDPESDDGLPDRGAIPGRSKEEVLNIARGFSSSELEQRFRRAQAEKRKFMSLRRVTDDILSKIRYLNQVAISMRAGLLDMEGAAQELDLTEKQLHDLVNRLRQHAGVEG